MSNKLIIFELNEVPYKVLDDYVARNQKSYFASILPKTAQLIASCPDKGYLHPRSSWQTFHRGVPDTTHGIIEYNQDTAPIDKMYPRLLDILRSHHVKVGCGASIGSYPVPNDKNNIAFWLPDPFASTDETFPGYMRYFQALNLQGVSGSGRIVRKNLSYKYILPFILYSGKLGIRPATYWKLLEQIISEQLNKDRIVRRRTFQALLTFDVVLMAIKRTQPDVATFFSNHVASSMHRYWAAKFPDDYETNKMPLDWRRRFANEIDYAMSQADAMLGQLIKFVRKHPEYKILCLGGMGQNPIPHEICKNQLMIKNVNLFMAFLGFSENQYQYLRAMEPQHVFQFSYDYYNQKFIAIIKELSINNKTPNVKA